MGIKIGTKIGTRIEIKTGHQQIVYSSMDTVYSRPAIIPARVRFRLSDDHGCIGFKEQNLAPRTETEVDAAVVQADHSLQSFQRRHGPTPQEVGHVRQKVRFFGTVFGAVSRFGAEVVNLPRLRDGQVQRIKPPTHHHDAVFAGVAAGAAGIEIFHRQHPGLGSSATGQRGYRGRERPRRFHADKMLPHVEARRAQKQREGEPMAGKGRGSILPGQQRMRKRRRCRGNQVRQLAQADRILTTARWKTVVDAARRPFLIQISFSETRCALSRISNGIRNSPETW